MTSMSSRRLMVGHGDPIVVDNRYGKIDPLPYLGEV